MSLKTDSNDMSANSSTVRASESRRMRLQGNGGKVADRVQMFERRKVQKTTKVEHKHKQICDHGPCVPTAVGSGSSIRAKLKQIGKIEDKGKGEGRRTHHREVSFSYTKSSDKENTNDNTISDFDKRERKLALARAYSKVSRVNFGSSEKKSPVSEDKATKTQSCSTPIEKINDYDTNRCEVTSYNRLCSSPSRKKKLDMIANARKLRREREQQRQNQLMQPVDYHPSDTDTSTNSVGNPPSVTHPSNCFASPDLHAPASKVEPQVKRRHIANDQQPLSQPKPCANVNGNKDEVFYTNGSYTDRRRSQVSQGYGNNDMYYSTNLQDMTGASGIGRGGAHTELAPKSEPVDTNLPMGNISQEYIEYPRQSTQHFNDSFVSGKRSINGDDQQYGNGYHVNDVSHATYGHQNKISSDCSCHDEDDDTQFNSVGMTSNHDTSKASASLSAVHNPNSLGVVEPKETKILSNLTNSNTSGGNINIEDSSHAGSRSHGIGTQVSHGICSRKGSVGDDDSASQSTFHCYGEGDDSVTTGSWTGRMRARQAAEAMVADNTYSTKNQSPMRLYEDQIDDDGLDRLSSSNMLLPNKISSSHLRESNTIQDSVAKLRGLVEEDSSVVTFTLGVGGALCGAMLMGPVGVFLGIGIGIGVTQVPEEHRKKCVNKIHESAIAANEIASNHCGSMCGEINLENEVRSIDNNDCFNKSGTPAISSDSVQDNKGLSPSRNDFSKVGGLVGVNNQDLSHHDAAQNNSNLALAWIGTRQAAPACHRMDKITPVDQIHSLDPSLHPRLWVEVMANAHTTHDEKDEAMEEILILAKDRLNARMMLEEGVLDSIMYIISDFIQSLDEEIISFVTHNTDPSFCHAKLAANCCIALGKAHHSAFHAEGGTLNGVNVSFEAVPVSKQVAEMLFQVPHHRALNKIGGDEISVAFKLSTDMTMRQAESTSKSIIALSEGNLTQNLVYN